MPRQWMGGQGRYGGGNRMKRPSKATHTQAAARQYTCHAPVDHVEEVQYCQAGTVQQRPTGAPWQGPAGVVSAGEHAQEEGG